MAVGTYLPDANIQYFDDAGAVLAFGKMTFFAAGTSTPLDVYSDVDLMTPILQPIVLNAAGKSTQPIFLGVASYKQNVTDANDVVMSGWPRDNIAAVSLTTTALGVAVFSFGGDASSPIPATQTVLPSGATYAACHAGSSFWELDSSDLVGGYVLQAMLMVLTAGTVTLSLVNLTDGSPDTPIVSIASSSTVGEQQTSAVIVFATGGSTKRYAIKAKTSGVVGFAWQAQVVRSS